MTHLVGLRLKNFERFRGEHVLALGPKAYAVVARDVLNEEQSNALGKSTLAESIRYALFGVAPRPHETIDDAISLGEDEMLVELEWSDGFFVSRGRKRGRFTDLQAEGDYGERWNQDAAQEWIDKRLGMTLEDFDTCAHVAQKAADRLVRTKGNGLADLVVGWTGLDKLADAEDLQAEALKNESEQVKRRREQLAALPDRTDARFSELSKKLADEIAAFEQRAKEVADAAAHNLAVHAYERHATRSHAAADTARELIEIRAGMARVVSDKEIEAARSAHTKAVADASPRRLKLAEAKKLAAGEFDGNCPFGIACPATDQINNDREGNKKKLAAAQRGWDEAESVAADANSTLRALQQLRDLRARSEQRIAVLETQAATYAESVAYVKDHADPGERKNVPENDAQPRVDARAAIKAFERARADATGIEERLVQEETMRVVQRAALSAIENTARKVAEGCGAAVQRGANQRLERAGIDLRVEFRWGRETKKPAARCSGCGAAFPASARVKQCGACGAERGVKLDDKPFLRVSPRSGGLEDLAGVAVALSASEWLRARRGSEWASVWLDEPFAGLDPVRRAALRSHLLNIVTGGFEQCFVVAHSRDVLDSLPGRIEVLGDGDWSSVRVVA